MNFVGIMGKGKLRQTQERRKMGAFFAGEFPSPGGVAKILIFDGVVSEVGNNERFQISEDQKDIIPDIEI